MTYYLRTIAILILGSAVFGQSSIAQEDLRVKSEQENKKQFANRRLLVRYKESAAPTKIDSIHFSVGAYVVKSFEVPHNLEMVEISRGISLEAALEFYKEDPNVLYAEPDYEYHAINQPAPRKPPSRETEVPPGPITDPELSRQWALHNSGQNGGTRDVDINAPEMWEQLDGDDSVIVAVIDTGVNYKHKDIRDNMWVNELEIPNNGIDDDHNNKIDDYYGYNAFAENGDPMDDHGHGTHCAGVIAAQGGNNFGGSGINPKGKIIACKFLSAHGSGTASGAIECLNYIRDLKRRSEKPVNIVATSNSWGGGPASQSLEDAIREHRDLGIVFVAAAGNDGLDNDEIESYPSDYPMANIISVAATDNKDDLAEFSNHGKRSVHVGAPGVDIWSTTLDNNYESMDGTSMATPHVAGLYAMISAAYKDLSYIQRKNLLIAGGVPIPSLEGKTVSGRRIRAVDTNGRGSLTCKDQIVTARLSPSQSRLLVPIGKTVTLSAININCEKPNGNLYIPVNSDLNLTLLDNGIGLDDSAFDGVYTNEWTPSLPGRYEIKFPEEDIVVVTVYDPASMKPYQADSEIAFKYRQFSGTALNATDDWVSTINTPFPIKFGGGGTGFDYLTIESNGVLSVTNTQLLGFNNQEFPVAQNMSVIAPYWDDLNPGVFGGDIFIETLGMAPKREFVVEWRNVRHYGATDDMTFQVVFFEDSPDVLFNYLSVGLGGVPEGRGGSATVGIQTSPDHYVTTSLNEQNLSDRQAIRYRLVP